MGCVSSTLLNHRDDDFSQIGGSTAFGHHIVSLTSTTYGLLTLDPPISSPSSSPDNNSTTTTTTTTPPTPAPRFTLGSFFPTTTTTTPDPKSLKPDEIINSWELMAGLDSNHSFRLNSTTKYDDENSNPNVFQTPSSSSDTTRSRSRSRFLLNLENKILVYTTSLRGIRKTFEDCNAVRSAIEGLGFQICERDISMDKSFKDELKQLLIKSKESSDLMIPPRVFVKGKYIGGVEEVMKMVEEGTLIDLLVGLPKMKSSKHLCQGCGGLRFLPCFHCNGSCKIVVVMEESRSLVIRCADCNENGLILCPICN